MDFNIWGNILLLYLMVTFNKAQELDPVPRFYIRPTYQVNIRDAKVFIANGVLLNKNNILTVFEPLMKFGKTGKGLFAGAGDNFDLRHQWPGRQLVEVKRIFRHPQNETFKVALVRVQEGFNYTSTVGPLRLANSRPKDPSICLFTSWGSYKGAEEVYPRNYESLHLRKQWLIYNTSFKCPDYNPEFCLCAASGSPGLRGTCPDDIGGPLACDGLLAALHFKSYMDCDNVDKGEAGAFVDVTHPNVKKFILDKMSSYQQKMSNSQYILYFSIMFICIGF